MTHLAVLNIVLLKFGSLKCSLLVHICICYVYKRHIFFFKKISGENFENEIGEKFADVFNLSEIAKLWPPGSDLSFVV